MSYKDLSGYIKKAINSDKKSSDTFMKKLIINWNDVIENAKFARYSTPKGIIKEGDKLILIILSYDGSVTVYLQGMIKTIERNIKLHIGYFPAHSIKILQKSPIFI